MEIVSVSGLILAISICIIAFFIGRLTSTGREDKKRLETELEQSREELSNYRSQVTSHFQETAHRVNALTENYRSVYEHLAQGAQDLCNKNDAPELINDLNRNPMLGGKTIKNSEVDHDILSAEASADSDSEPEKTDENPDNTTASEDQVNSNDGEADRESNSAENSEADKSSDRDNMDYNENNSDEPIIVTEEGARSGK